MFCSLYKTRSFEYSKLNSLQCTYIIKKRERFIVHKEKGKWPKAREDNIDVNMECQLPFSRSLTQNKSSVYRDT